MAEVIKDEFALTEKALAVVNAAKAMTGDFTNYDLAAQTGMSVKSVNGVLLGLCRKGILARGEKTTVEVNGENKPAQFIKVTEYGAGNDFHIKG